MRISDWSSDVCSSDLITVRRRGADINIACERLACGYGLLPNTEMAASLGCRLATHDGAQTVAVDSWQTTSVGHIFAAGECTGIGGMELSAAEGRLAAYAALNQPGQARALLSTRARYRRFAARMHAALTM